MRAYNLQALVKFDSESNGNAAANEQFQVFNDDGTTLASLFSDDGATPFPQPLTTDQNGRATFYAANGTYSVRFLNNSVASIADVEGLVLLDPDEIDAASLGGETASEWDQKIKNSTSQYGLGVNSILIQDPNAQSTMDMKTAFLRISSGATGIANMPKVGFFNIVQVAFDNSSTTQTAYEIVSESAWYREYSSSSWSDWKPIFTDKSLLLDDGGAILLDSGNYHWVSTSGINHPLGATGRWHIQHSKRDNGGGEVQVWSPENSNFGPRFYRNRVSGAWSFPVIIYDSNNPQDEYIIVNGTTTVSRAAKVTHLFVETSANITITLDASYGDKDAVKIYKTKTAGQLTFTTSSGTITLPDGSQDASNIVSDGINAELTLLKKSSTNEFILSAR